MARPKPNARVRARQTRRAGQSGLVADFHTDSDNPASIVCSACSCGHSNPNPRAARFFNLWLPRPSPPRGRWLHGRARMGIGSCPIRYRSAIDRNGRCHNAKRRFPRLRRRAGPSRIRRLPICRQQFLRPGL